MFRRSVSVLHSALHGALLCESEHLLELVEVDLGRKVQTGRRVPHDPGLAYRTAHLSRHVVGGTW